ncbi:hypothetical protein [Bradyrhizobium sp. JR18.2]|uniref:hypothetical protein n=1 Tax=Bradyrhizobium sp. JR18.2 TaxID=3156369 RepID=UPI003399F3DE
MIAKIFYLTSPAPGRYLVNFQLFGSEEITTVEIAKAHLANVVIDGASFALRESHRVQPTTNTESTHGDDRRQQPA